MLVKLGVDISRLKRPMRRGLKSIDVVFRRHGREAVITSTYDGNHSPASLHYANLAIDLRLPTAVMTVLIEITTELKQSLGNNYDVVQEHNHYHIEYDVD